MADGCIVCGFPVVPSLAVCADHATRDALAAIILAQAAEIVALRLALETAGDRGTMLALQASVRAKAAEESLAVAQATIVELQGRIIRARGPS